MRILIMGPPGAGKGTHGRLLSQRYSIPHISSGALLRAEIAAGTSAGRAVEEAVNAGALAPAQVVDKIIYGALARIKSHHAGFVLDGYPRSLGDVRFVRSALTAFGQWHATNLVAISITDDAATRRILGASRGRKDDTPEVIARRLADFHEITEPAISQLLLDEHLGGRHLIDGHGTVAEVQSRILGALES